MNKSRSKGSVRMGPISIFSLIILLSMAVLAVLTASTAQATYASAEKQARFTNDTYTNEVQAQELVADIDEKLAQVRSEGGTRDDALKVLESSLPNGTWIEDDTVCAEFYQESGRILTITLTITDDANYRITQWQATILWDTDNNETLWQGGTEEG